jgi:hypothetical protein
MLEPSISTSDHFHGKSRKNRVIGRHERNLLLHVSKKKFEMAVPQIPSESSCSSGVGEDDSESHAMIGLELGQKDIDVSNLAIGSCQLAAGSLYIMRNSNVATCLTGLHDFCLSLERQRGSGSDPRWEIHSFLNSRPGGDASKSSSLKLLDGSPVDPRSNTAHRLATQYLADIQLLKYLSRDEEMVVVTAVGYFCSQQERMHMDMIASTSVHYLVFIALDSPTMIQVGSSVPAELGAGDVLVLPWSRNLPTPTCIQGKGVSVVLGVPLMPPSCRRRYKYTETNARIQVSSALSGSRPTSSRIGKDQPSFQTLVACSDCRRPLRVGIWQQQEENIPNNSEGHVTLVTVACDEEEIAWAVETGRRVSSSFDGMLLLVTSEALLTDDVRSVWPNCEVVTPLTRWKQRRGMKDYNVPDGFISPLLFPKSGEIKDSCYTLVQAIGIQSLWNRHIWLMDPKGEHGVEVTPNKIMYRQMVAELRDWNHPCHKWRESPIAFIQEWTNAYEYEFSDVIS